jgi:hypothetical protein
MRTAKMIRTFLLFFLLMETELFAASYKLETITAPPDGMSDSIKALLQLQGHRVVNDQGAAWCEVWVRKEITNLNKPGSPDAKFPTLHIGELVGVMKFNATGSDYRGQPIKPGTYFMRYCLILQDGNHLGVAPILDFVLLTPSSQDDKEPDAVMNILEVVGLSRKASGTNHPAVISMAVPPSAAGEALLEKDDLDHWVLTVKTQSKPPADLQIGIVVVGKTEG